MGEWEDEAEREEEGRAPDWRPRAVGFVQVGDAWRPGGTTRRRIRSRLARISLEPILICLCTVFLGLLFYSWSGPIRGAIKAI